MLGFNAKTKKEVKELIGQNVEYRIIETSFFGKEYHGNGKYAVVISPNPEKIRKVFGTILVENNILKGVL